MSKYLASLKKNNDEPTYFKIKTNSMALHLYKNTLSFDISKNLSNIQFNSYVQTFGSQIFFQSKP